MTNKVSYHINNVTHRVGPCGAAVKKCPFGGNSGLDNHFATEKEAYYAYEVMRNNDTFPKPQTGIYLKKMDANDLAHELFEYVERLDLDKEEFAEILELSSILHAKQYRRNRGKHKRAPYIEHPLRATLRILRAGVTNPSLIKSPLLHDTIEDGSVIFAEAYLDRPAVDEAEARKVLSEHLSKRFGNDTSELVNAVTNDLEDPSVKKNQNLQDKTDTYVAHLREEVKDNPGALIVKCVGDYFDNAGSLHHTDGPGNEIKTYKQAYKYLPCIQVFREEFDKPNPYATQEMIDDWQNKLNRIESRLKFLINKHQEAFANS